MARLIGASVLSAVLVAGCGTTTSPPASAGPPATSASSAAASPSVAAPTAGATSSPTTRPSTAAVCDPGPIRVSEFLAADPSCYRSADVSVMGWWGPQREDDAFAGANLGHVLRGALPIGPMSEHPEDFLLVDETEIVPDGGWPVGVHWATVAGRRSDTNDRACYRDPAADIQAPPTCPSYLVASKVVESDPPAWALAGCLTIPSGEGGSWVAVEEFTAFPTACFGTTDITVRGWFDIRYIITGWEASWGIVPGWLWLPIGPWRVVSGDSNALSPSALLVYLDPARKVDASRTNRWVFLTGHYADAKAKTCHVEYDGGYQPARDGERIPDSYARRLCEAHFVVTSIEDAQP